MKDTANRKLPPIIARPKSADAGQSQYGDVPLLNLDVKPVEAWSEDVSDKPNTDLTKSGDDHSHLTKILEDETCAELPVQEDHLDPGGTEDNDVSNNVEPEPEVPQNVDKESEGASKPGNFPLIVIFLKTYLRYNGYQGNTFCLGNCLSAF